MTRLEHRARTWALSALRRAESVLSPTAPVLQTCTAPVPTVSLALADRLERGELAAEHDARAAAELAAEDARRAALLDSLEAGMAALELAREHLDADHRPPDVIAAWLEVAS